MQNVGIPKGVQHTYCVVVGYPLSHPEELMDSPNLWTHERFIPKILKELGIVESITWVKKNRPDLYIELEDKFSFFTICIGKLSKIHSSKWITFLVGKKDPVDSVLEYINCWAYEPFIECVKPEQSYCLDNWIFNNVKNSL